LFVITAAIIRVVLTLGANASALNVNRWGVRETIVGIITVNIPILRPMFSKTFWRTGQVSYPSSGGTKTGGRNTTLATGEGPYEMTGSVSGTSRRKDSFGGSEEFIIDNSNKKGSLKPGGNNVMVHTMYHVTSEDAKSNQQTNEWDQKISTGAYRNGSAV
jgi:hypothetical protein